MSAAYIPPARPRLPDRSRYGYALRLSAHPKVPPPQACAATFSKPSLMIQWPRQCLCRPPSNIVDDAIAEQWRRPGRFPDVPDSSRRRVRTLRFVPAAASSYRRPTDLAVLSTSRTAAAWRSGLACDSGGGHHAGVNTGEGGSRQRRGPFLGSWRSSPDLEEKLDLGP